ncbi:MAG: transglutaminase domain-containing protein [Balneolaceae bacterium]
MAAIFSFIIAFLFLGESTINTIDPGVNEKWSKIDEHVLNAPPHIEQEVKTLAGYFLKVADTDAGKARAIYRWITDRIAYDTNALSGRNLQNISAQDVLENRKAICTGYVILFKELAKMMGLNVETITGHSKGYGFDPHDKSPLVENHSWVAVRIDNDWHLADPTWGAGYISSDSEKFIPHFSEFYFLSNPEQLIYTHFPLDNTWQLLEQPVTESEYHNYPVVTHFFFQNGLHFDEVRDLHHDTNGKFSTNFLIPDDTVVQSEVTHIETGITENVLIRINKKNLDLSVRLSRTGLYKLELFARALETENHDFHLATYFYLNNSTPSVINSYPRLLGYYDITRARLISPLTYELSDTLSYDFEIIIPGAEEAYVNNQTLNEWYKLERDGQHFSITTAPGKGKIKLVARFPDDDFFSVFAEFTGE